MDEPPGRVHRTHPFAPPEVERDPVRRLRGRLTAPVTLWTSAAEGERAGLTVASVLVAAGSPGLVVGLVHPDSDLYDVMLRSGRVLVHVLEWEHRAVADVFGGQRPAPGGPFRGDDWEPTQWGPRLLGVPTWAGVRLVDDLPAGWSRLVRAEVEQVSAADVVRPLLYHRGRYRTTAGPE